MAAITLEELLKKVGLCPEKLNDSVSDDRLREVALFLTSWRTVASHLDLDENDLDDAEQGGKKVKDKSLKALQIWMGKFGFKATHRKLVEVLLSLAMADVAEKVCNLLKEGIPVHKTSTKLQSKSREHEESDARSASDGLTDVLSKRPEFQQLSTSEQEELMVTLYDDEKSIKLLFGKLVVKTCDSVEERVPVVKFARSILALGACDPAPGERDPALLDEHSEEIKRAGSISEIFNILSTYWNYLNYEILEYVIEMHGTSDDAERLRNYNKELNKFCKRRIFELPPDSGNGNTLSPKQAKFRVKLNIRKDITYEQLLQIRGRIAKILKIRLAALVLSRVDEGCVQLLFLIPKFVAKEIFPLSCEQTSALCRDVALIRLECGQYIFETCTCEMYTEDDNTVLKEMEDKSQLQTEPCVERQVQTTETNREPQTPGEGHELELLEKKLEKTGLESLEHSAVTESVTSPKLKSSTAGGELPTRDMIDSPCWGVSTGKFAGVSTVDPTTVTDDHWVRAIPPFAPSAQKTLGKWLVFKQLDKLDETWHMIRKAVESGELDSTGAKCSTAMPDPSSHPNDSNIGVICVYTSEEMMDQVGFDLVKMVEQDIRYKTDEATLQGRHIATGYTNVSLQTIYWNGGNPHLKKYGGDKAPRVDPSRLPTEPPYTVYLGNLSYECTEDDILEFFERRNITVISVRLPVERGTSQLRGFGYAELENTQALMEALSLRGEPLRGRQVKVDIAGVKKTGGSWRGGRDQDDPTMGDWRQGMGDGERSPPPQDSQGGYHYHGGRGYDQYRDYGPSQRYERGSHYRDTYGSDGYHPQRRSLEDRRDPYGDHAPPQRYERGSHYRDTYGSDGYHPQRGSPEDQRQLDRRRDELPKERPRIQLQPRTKPPEDKSGGRERGEGGRASSSIFGQAKPVDTAAREREIEERLLKLDIGRGGRRKESHEQEERQASGRECDRPRGLGRRREDCHPASPTLK